LGPVRDEGTMDAVSLLLVSYYSPFLLQCSTHILVLYSCTAAQFSNW